MSYVTDVWVFCSVSEQVGDDGSPPAPIMEINEWTVAEGKGALADVAESAGGHKCSQVLCYAAAFNWIDEVELWDRLRNAPWQYPESVIVVWKSEQDEAPHVRGLEATT